MSFPISVVPLDGVIEYSTVEGRFRFPANSKTKFRSTPEKDSTGRTVKWTTCTLTIEAYISAGDYFGVAQRTVDNDFSAVRRILESPSGQLSISNKGLGSLLLNRDTSGLVCCDWGPFPKVLECELLGNVSAYIVWEVEYKYLNSRLADAFGVAEFSWDARFELNEDGATTRTISGHISIVGAKQSVYNFQRASSLSNVDEYREYLEIECPLGFVRDKQIFSVDPAKTRLDFNIVDRQLPHEAYPVGISDMDCDWDLDSVTDKGIFTRFSFVFTGSAKAALNYPKSLALQALRNEHDFRFINLLRQLKSQQGSIIPLPARFRVREKTKGQDARRVHFSAAWILTVLPANAGNYFPADILTRCGFFKQKENSAEAWREGMVNLDGTGSLQVRGHANLTIGSNDEIRDLRKFPGKTVLPVFGGTRKFAAGFGAAYDTLPFVPIDQSYHEYRNDLEAHTVYGGVVPIKIDPSDQVSAEVKIDVDRSRFRMWGTAYRYNARPVVPELVKINGSKAVRFGIPVIRHFDVKNLNGVSIYGAIWEIWYQILDNKASKNGQSWIPNPANPESSRSQNQPNIVVPVTVVGED